MMGNISALVDGVKWYLGIPMNDTANLRLQIAHIGEKVLGDNLLGFQVGNEPDLYGRHGVGGRPDTYSPYDYFGEFAIMMNAINADAEIPVKNRIIGPSVTGQFWTPEQVFDTGYIAAYGNNLGFISVERWVSLCLSLKTEAECTHLGTQPTIVSLSTVEMDSLSSCKTSFPSTSITVQASIF